MTVNWVEYYSENPDPDFERLLREEEAIEEGLRSQRLQRLAEAKVSSTLAYCTLVQNGHMSSVDAITAIHKIVG